MMISLALAVEVQVQSPIYANHPKPVPQPPLTTRRRERARPPAAAAADAAGQHDAQPDPSVPAERAARLPAVCGRPEHPDSAAPDGPKPGAAAAPHAVGAGKWRFFFFVVGLKSLSSLCA